MSGNEHEILAAAQRELGGLVVEPQVSFRNQEGT
jgi:hypothetical protein